MTQIDFGSLYHIQNTVSFLTPESKEDILKLLFIDLDINLVDFKNSRVSSSFLPQLPYDIDWTPEKITSGRYRGSLAKRLYSFYQKEYGIILSDLLIQKINDIAEAGSFRLENIYYDFYPHIGVNIWKAGAFGDYNSCFFSSHDDARYYIQRHNGFALRVFSDLPGIKDIYQYWISTVEEFGFQHDRVKSARRALEEGYGLARCWVIPVKKKNIHVVFNGYGLPGDTSRTLSILLGKHLDQPVKRIDLTNQRNPSGTIYINSGRGYVIGEYDLSEYDLGIRDKIIGTCKTSGERIFDKDKYVNLSNGDKILIQYAENYKLCAFCNNYAVDYDEYEGNTICGDCADKYIICTCVSCGKPRFVENYVRNREICNECKENSFVIQGVNDSIFYLPIRSDKKLW